MKAIATHQYDAHPPRWVLDLREADVLSAWRTVAARLETNCQPGGLTSLLLKDSDTEPGPAGTEALRCQAEMRLPMLVSSTREINIFGAMVAALPLVSAGQDLSSSWLGFLAGYACGLETSPALDARRIRFLREFDNAIMATRMHSDRARQARVGERAVHEGIGSSWTRVVLEAISYGGATVAALLAKRTMSADHVSGADTMLGALLGSALWRGCPCESDLIGRLCGSRDRFPRSHGTMH